MHEVRDLRNGYFALFLKTGEPIFYLLAVNGDRRAERGGGMQRDTLLQFTPPKRKAFPIASEQLEELQCLPIALPIARQSRVGCCYTT